MVLSEISAPGRTPRVRPRQTRSSPDDVEQPWTGRREHESMRRYAAVIDAPVRVATLGEPSGDDPSMGSSRRAAVAGASVGVAATLGMSAVMMAGQRFGLTGRHPPEEIVDRSAERLTGHRSEEQHADAAGAIA